MKKFYMTMVAMLCGVAAMAQQYDNELYVPEVTVKAGTTGEIKICLKNTLDISFISFKFKTASGIKLTTKVADFGVVEDRLDLEKAKLAAKAYAKKQLDNGDIDEDEYADALDEIDDYGISDVFKVDKQGPFTFGPIATAAAYKDESGNVQRVTFKGNDGALLTCPVTVPSDLEDGAYELQLTDIVLAYTPEGESIAQNVSIDHPISVIKVNVGEGTGINSINAADSKAPVYNLAGQRVSKAQKGVYIQGGKKVAVK
jgi:hypothetical protein